MDPALVDLAIYKEFVHFGGGKTTTMNEPIKVNPAGQEIKHLVPDEDIKQLIDLALERTDEMEGNELTSWTREDEENLYKNQTLSEIIASACGTSVSELEQPFENADEDYDFYNSDLHNPIPGPIYASEELAFPFGESGGIVQDEFISELKYEDYFGPEYDLIHRAFTFKNLYIGEEISEEGRALLDEVKRFCEC